ncbi:MerR family transcriptional regulator [Thalassoglobus sp. JC818]|uniref:MerR family transcriptional regulator n=1 Tax=Thalassoglobus sp. JC818 TaxID=3232136 RepID=UPI00345A2A2C
MADVTSRDIMQAADISNVATLVRWHGKEGLIPPPDVRTHPNGRGKMAYWPEWVLERCLRIKQLRKEGRSLAEIRQLLGDDWKKAEREHQRRYVFSEVSHRMDVRAAQSNLQQAVEQFLTTWIKERRAANIKSSVQTITVEVMQRAIELMEQGVNPVLIVTADNILVTADFAVSVQLASFDSIEDAFMVIPIWRELSAYAAHIATLPECPAVQPISRVKASVNAGSKERLVCVMSSWDFEMEAPKVRRKSKKD